MLNSVEASSIDGAINLMNAYMSKELNLSHARLVIFSEEVAFDGISDEIYTLTNNSQIRPSVNIIISKSKAKDYLENSESPLENLITKHYQIFPNSSKYTGYVYDATLADFMDALVSKTAEPFAILGGINKNEKDSSENSSNIADIKSTDTSIVGDSKIENFGVAVFKGDKMVGELTALDTLCLSILKRQVDSFLIQVPDSENNYKKVDIVLYPVKKNSIKVDIVNGSPYITIDAHFLGRINSMSNNSKYLDNSTLEHLSNESKNYLNEVFTKYLYKTTLTFNSDINDFGKYASKKFLINKDFDEYNWTANYTNSIFKVNIDVNVDSGLLITET